MPIPEDMGKCIEHFMSKGKPRKQAIAICLSVKRRRETDNTHEAIKKHGGLSPGKEQG